MVQTTWFGYAWGVQEVRELFQQGRGAGLPAHPRAEIGRFGFGSSLSQRHASITCTGLMKEHFTARVVDGRLLKFVEIVLIA